MNERLTAKWGIDITRADIVRLDGLNWLNDEVGRLLLSPISAVEQGCLCTAMFVNFNSVDGGGS